MSSSIVLFPMKIAFLFSLNEFSPAVCLVHNCDQVSYCASVWPLNDYFC